MLITRVDKEPPDVTRIVVDMAWWLDPNEHITQIVSAEVIVGMSGWSEAPYPPPDSPPPYDPTPLILLSSALDTTQRIIIMFVEFGTSGVAYTIQFIVDGTSQRRVTFEVGVQLTGVPPEQPMPLPTPPVGPGTDPLDWYLPLKGGTMEGPLYLFHNPKYPTEAVTKHYVDGMSFVGGPFMAEAGGTFTGAVSMGESALTLSATSPIDPLEAASKQYVDGLLGSVTAPFVPLSGATMTGLLVLSDDPTDVMGAATKGYVDTQIGSEGNVISFNTRTGAVAMVAQDISDAGGALLDSPTFFGIPHAPTAAPGTNTTQLATTEYVTASVIASTTGVISFNSRAGVVTLGLLDVTAVGGAPIASPVFTGNPQAPTLASTDNSASLATTAFVKSVVGVPGGAIISATPPTSPPGSLWWDSVGGQLYVRYDDGNSVSWVPASALAVQGVTYGNMPVGVQQVPLAFSIIGKPASGARYNFVTPMMLTIPPGLAGTVAYANTLAAANAVFTVLKLSGGATTTLGTITIVGGLVMSVTLAGAGGAMAAGDVMQLCAPVAQDATLADMGITILGMRV